LLKNLNLFEGMHDASEGGLRRLLLAQAKVRLGFAAIVVCFETYLFSVAAHGIPFWFLLLASGYGLYVAIPFCLVALRSERVSRTVLVATAVSDPLMMTVWIVLTGEFSSLIAGFYLFTTLGFGFRTGRPLMHLCQVASIVGFTIVFVCDPYWRSNAIVWSALTIPVAIVPFYASTLIEQLRKSREHAEKESRAKSDLLAKVSHELRTPLTGIMAAAELLSIESNDRGVRKRTQTILTLSDNLLREINDLLDEAKYDAQAIALSPAPIDLNDKVSVLRTTFETMAAKKGVAFRADIDPSIKDMVVIDAHHLNRVLLNLAGNAVKFTDKGIVRLTIELLEQSSDQYRLRFCVSDTGVGIPESFHSKMFTPFSQVEQGTTRRFGGTGLGLTLSKKIVDLMGSELKFESTYGKGSRFWFDLSLERQAKKVTDTAGPVINVVSPKRILVAEDNVTNLILIKEMLHVDHHDVVTCTSGVEALEILSEQEFDLLLLDYNLGDMDGVRVLQTYQFGKLNPAPAIFLTADATLQTANRLEASGAVAVLHKPISLTVLRKTLQEIEFSGDLEKAAVPFVAAVEVMPRSERPALKVVRAEPLDMDAIDQLRFVNDRPGFLAMLLSHAEDDITKCSDQIVEALNARNYATVPSIAHALKGVSSNVGAVRLAGLASSMMNMSSGELDGSRERLTTDLRSTYRSALEALAKIVESESVASGSLAASSLHLD
jgi:two-component system, sensor histidine kinase RpfC